MNKGFMYFICLVAAMGGLLFGLLEIADTYVHAPCGFKLQIMNRCKEWVER